MSHMVNFHKQRAITTEGMVRYGPLSHIQDTFCHDNPVCICNKLFPSNWLSACRDDYRKSCILNGERLLCPARNVNHLMTSDVNKWRDVTQ